MAWQTLLELTTIAIVVYVIFGAFLFFNQRNMIYHPDEQDLDTCPGFDDATLLEHNGTRFYHKQQSDTVIVYYHGNAGSACDRAPIKDRFADLGYSYAFVEYTGYSGDKTTPTKQRLHQNVEHVTDYLTRKDYDRVIVVGVSLGSALAAYHTTLMNVDAVILISPIDSVESVARHYYPFYPVTWLVRDDYNTVAHVTDYTGRLLIIHPKRDSVVPARHGQKVYDTATTKNKRLLTPPTERHGNVFSDDSTWDEIRSFLNPSTQE